MARSAFAFRLGWRRPAAALAGAAVLAVGALATVAQDTSQTALQTAGILAGTCADVTGDPRYRLNDLSVLIDDVDDDDDGTTGDGTLVGSADAVPVVGSTTEVNVSMGALLQEPHAVAVHAGDGSGDVTACGEVGGISVNDEDLHFALVASDGSGYAGIAVLDDDDDDDEVEVTVYLASPGATAGGTGSGQAAGNGTAGDDDDDQDDDDGP